MPDSQNLWPLIYLSIALIGVAFSWVYRKRLREVAPDVAARIARPLGRNTIASDWAGTVFLVKRDYASFGDPKLTKAGDRLLVMFFVLLILTFGPFLALFGYQFILFLKG